MALMDKISLLLLFLILILSSSCEKKLVLPSSQERKIVLLGELVAEDSIALRGGQSTPVSSGSTTSSELISSLTIEFQSNTGQSGLLTGREDDISSALTTVVCSSSQPIQAGAAYELTASSPGFNTASVSVKIPGAFNASVIDTSGVDYNGEACIRFRLSINDLPEKNYYTIEVVQQPYIIADLFFFNGEWLDKNEHMTTYDSLLNAGESVTEKSDSLFARIYNRVQFYTEETGNSANSGQQVRRVLLEDKPFNGTNKETAIFVPRSSLQNQFPVGGLRTLVQVKSISEDYFRYLQGYETYDPFSGPFSGTTPSYALGNVVNGIGIVGGVFRRTFVYMF
jgi:hypothetical protein